jgi:hypothetical protein
MVECRGLFGRTSNPSDVPRKTARICCLYEDRPCLSSLVGLSSRCGFSFPHCSLSGRRLTLATRSVFIAAVSTTGS